jgi:hypothetical protein
MYPYMNEDAAFERLKDLQREMENSRLVAGSAIGLGSLFRNWAERAWWVAGLAMRRPPRRSPAATHSGRSETAGFSPDA